MPVRSRRRRRSSSPATRTTRVVDRHEPEVAAGEPLAPEDVRIVPVGRRQLPRLESRAQRRGNWRTLARSRSSEQRTRRAARVGHAALRERYIPATWPRSRRGSSGARCRSPTSRRSASACSRTVTARRPSAGDVAVINTCCVTNEAVAKSRQAAAQAARTHAAGHRHRLRRQPLRQGVRRPARQRPGDRPPERGARRRRLRPTSARSAASRPTTGSTGSARSSGSRTAARSRARSA